MAMRAPVTGTSSNFEILPEGQYVGRCVRLVDLGTQRMPFGEDEWKRQVWIMWEVPEERRKWTKDGEEHEGPAAISSYYNMTMNENANLRKMLESWQGKSFTDEEAEVFDIASVLGRPCMLTVTHYTAKKTGETKAKVANVTALHKSMTAPPQEGETIYVSLDPNDFDPEQLAKLSDRMRKGIESTHEYRLASGAQAPQEPQQPGLEPPPPSDADMPPAEDVPF